MIACTKTLPKKLQETKSEFVKDPGHQVRAQNYFIPKIYQLEILNLYIYAYTYGKLILSKGHNLLIRKWSFQQMVHTDIHMQKENELQSIPCSGYKS